MEHGSSLGAPVILCTIGIEDPEKEKVVGFIFYGIFSIEAESTNPFPSKKFHLLNHLKIDRKKDRGFIIDHRAEISHFRPFGGTAK